MGGRGRGRPRGYGRVKPFPNTDQLKNPLPAEKVSSVQNSFPYPPLDFFPAPLSTHKDYDDILTIKEQMSTYFQSSNYHLKLEDQTAKLFSSQGEAVTSKKTLLNFDWDYFPLELRPAGKRKQKKYEDIMNSLREHKMAIGDLAWLDKLEEKEKVNTGPSDTIVKEEKAVKKETEENAEEDEAEEIFDDEELDFDTDYNTNYFDNGEGYLDEDNDLDEGPCF